MLQRNTECTSTVLNAVRSTQYAASTAARSSTTYCKQHSIEHCLLLACSTVALNANWRLVVSQPPMRGRVKIKESGKRGEERGVCAVRCVWVATPEELNIKNLVLRGF